MLAADTRCSENPDAIVLQAKANLGINCCLKSMLEAMYYDDQLGLFYISGQSSKMTGALCAVLRRRACVWMRNVAQMSLCPLPRTSWPL